MEITTKRDQEEIDQAIAEGKTVLYRYHDVWRYDDSGTKKVALFAYIVIRETPKGVWIMGDGYGGLEKWVDTNPHKTSKRFAYLNKEDTMKNFIRRKAKQVQILKQQLHGIRTAMASINETVKEEFADEALEGFKPRPSADRQAG